MEEMNKIAGIKRQPVLKVNLTAKVLPVWIFKIPFNNRFISEVDICLNNKRPTMVLIGIDGLPTLPYNGADSFSMLCQSIFFASRQSSCPD